MFNSITSYQCTSSTEPCFAMDCQCSRLFLGNLQKLMHDFYGRTRTVCKIQLMMFYSSFLKQATIIGLIIKPDYCIYFYFFEYWYVILWCKQYVLGYVKSTPESSLGLSQGELKATNLPGIIQLISPFYIFSQCSY